MSYILDALKKSQQERQKSSNPTIQSLHHNISPAEPDRRPLVITITLIVVVLVCFLSYQFFLQKPQQEQPPAVNASVNMPANEPVNADTSKTASSASPQTMPSVVASDKPAVANTVVELWELPDPVQAEIPALTFSFHVFSNNPERRTIIINGRRLKEGGQVVEHLQLLEITESGVVLSWKNRHQFYIPVVESW
jgi:general secretion pathway protein B